MKSKSVDFAAKTSPLNDFVPRGVFNFDPTVKWFPHHMAKAKVAIPKKLPIVDLLVEVRDCRVPITSSQFELDSLIRLRPHQQRIVILNKQDLVSKAVVRQAVSLLELEGTPVLSTSAVNASNITPIMNFITENVQPKFKSLGVNVMVTGLPNTGKSTLINAMRSASPHPALDKAPAKMSGFPGSTREIGRILLNSHHPKIYVLDTPGVMLTRSAVMSEDDAPDIMMKLAAVGCMPDTVPGVGLLADYVLYQLNKRGMLKYVSACGMEEPSNDIDQVIDGLARSMNKGNHRVDHHGATIKFIHNFREGRFGKVCLDEIPDVDTVLDKIEKEKNFEFPTEPPGPWGPETYPIQTLVRRAIYKAPHSYSGK